MSWLENYECNDYREEDIDCYSCGDSTNRGRCSCGYVNE